MQARSLDARSIPVNPEPMYLSPGYPPERACGVERPSSKYLGQGEELIKDPGVLRVMGQNKF
jgi:hypothetical protein